MVCTCFNSYAWLYNILAKIFLSPKKQYIEIQQSAQATKEHTVLDIGGGTGLVAQYFVSHVKTITIVDPAERMLKKVPKGIKVIQGTAQQLPFPDNHFDIIYCCDAFHHFSNGYNNKDQAIEQACHELVRVLTKKGKIIICEFHPQKRKAKIIIWLENSFFHWGSTFFTPEELMKRWTTKGMTCISHNLNDHMSYKAVITFK